MRDSKASNFATPARSRTTPFVDQPYICQKHVAGSWRKMAGHSDLDACIRSAESFGGRVLRSRDQVVVFAAEGVTR